MLKWFIRRRLAAFERANGYDLSYAREVLDADLGGFLRFARVSGMAEFRKDVPVEPWIAAKLTGTLAEDCGPCTQLVITMAERDGVPATALRAMLSGDLAAMSDDVALATRFARAALAHTAEADELRDRVVQRWGKRGLVSLAFALTSARMFPTLKYALGHGHACTRVTVAGALAPFSHVKV